MCAAHALALVRRAADDAAARARHRGPGTGHDRRWATASSPAPTAGGIGLYWRPADYGRVAGRTYIAWCLAAVSLPVLAGYLFDLTRAYVMAVLIAAGANVAGMAMALTLPRRGWRKDA